MDNENSFVTLTKVEVITLIDNRTHDLLDGVV